MDNILITFLNLFFVPMIAVYIDHTRRKEAMCFCTQFVVRYCVFASLVFLLTKLLSRGVNVFVPLDSPPRSAYYTVFAVLAAALLPLILEFFRKYFRLTIAARDNKNEEEKD